MTTISMALKRLLDKAGSEEFLRNALENMLQLLMDADVSGQIRAARHERTPARDNYRNGFRERRLDTGVGELQLHIPKLRHGSYFPEFLEPRRLTDKSLLAVIQEAWIQGVSTRKVEGLVQSMGLSGISKSQVSAVCKEIDERVQDFIFRPLEGEWPYLWLDATYLKVREGGRVVSVAAIIAMAVNREGRREIVGLHTGPNESETFWSDFLRQLLRRGLSGVQLVISDAHEGLKAAIGKLPGVTWQRCRVHWLRNALSHVPKSCQAIVATALRQIFVQVNSREAHATWQATARSFEKKWPRLAVFMDNSESDVLAYMDFPQNHWSKIYSTNPLERLNKEVKRRSAVVGIFPCNASIVRLIGAVLMEQNDEWLLQDRYMPRESLERLTGTAKELAVA